MAVQKQTPRNFLWSLVTATISCASSGRMWLIHGTDWKTDRKMDQKTGWVSMHWTVPCCQTMTPLSSLVHSSITPQVSHANLTVMNIGNTPVHRSNTATLLKHWCAEGQSSLVKPDPGGWCSGGSVMFRMRPCMDNPVATVTADLGAGDCLMECGPALLNVSSLHDQIYGVYRSVFQSVLCFSHIVIV